MQTTHKPSVRIIATLIILIIILLAITAFSLIRINELNTDKIVTDKTKTTSDKNLIITNNPYLHDEGVVIIEKKPVNSSSSTTTTDETIILPIQKVLFEYVEIINSCSYNFSGECLRVRSGPGTDYPVVTRLRNNVVLKIDGQVKRDGITWYKVIFDEWLRYPERVGGDWYIAADYAEVLLDEGVKTTWDENHVANTPTTKEIVVDRGEQKLYAYNNGNLFMSLSISTGLELTPTPRGTFTIFKKTPSRYMQGPLPNLTDKQYYDLPGVPWNLYFTEGGAVIHGAYWHESFGQTYSHGCVNLPPSDARTLYNWAELGTKVTVKD